MPSDEPFLAQEQFNSLQWQYSLRSFFFFPFFSNFCSLFFFAFFSFYSFSLSLHVYRCKREIDKIIQLYSQLTLLQFNLVVLVCKSRMDKIIQLTGQFLFQITLGVLRQVRLVLWLSLTKSTFLWKILRNGNIWVNLNPILDALELVWRQLKYVRYITVLQVTQIYYILSDIINCKF